MEFEPRDFFTEKEDTDVDGFVIIDADAGNDYPSYRIAEKWNRPNDSDTWITYEMSEEALLARIERNDCAKTRELTDKQYRGVLNLAGVADQELAA